jgi:hypothetical protein
MTFVSGDAVASNDVHTPYYATGGANDVHWISNISEITQLDYKVNLIENDSETTFISEITDEEYIIRFVGLNNAVVNNTTFGTVISKNKAGVLISNTAVTTKGYTTNTNILNPQATWNKFELSFTMYLGPVYLNNETGLTTLDNPKRLSGTKSYRVIHEFNTLRNSNPNTKKTFVHDATLGNVGYFGEMYNGGLNIFKILNLAYSDVNDFGKNKITAGEVTKVYFEIERSTGTFNASQKWNFGIMSILDNYSNSYFDYGQNHNLITSSGVANPTYESIIGDITNFKVVESGDKLIVSFVINPNFINQTTPINQGDRYLIYFGTIDNDNNNDVNLVVDFNTYDVNRDVNLITTTTFANIPHPHDYTDYTNKICAGTFGVEEGVLSYVNFRFDSNNKETKIKSAKFKIIVIDTTQDLRDHYILREVKIPIQNEWSKRKKKRTLMRLSESSVMRRESA